MANEINIQAVLTVQRSTPPMCASGALDITQTGKHCICNVQNIGTGAEALVLGDCATMGYLFVKNVDPTNYVQLGLDSGVSTQVFAKLKPNEFCLIPCNQIPIYAKANTAACDVVVAAAEL
jgi:hypothetical protein